MAWPGPARPDIKCPGTHPIEYTSVITQIIKESRQNEEELAIIWQDLANAYGTIPHKLVELTLARFNAPGKFGRLIQD